MAKSASQSFDENERPTAPRSRAIDPNVTARFKVGELETLVRTESGTRAVVTSEDIDCYVRERSANALRDAQREPEAEAEPQVPDATPLRERETLDATTLQRETVVIYPDLAPPPQHIPIDVDLSRLSPVRRPRVDARHVMIAVALFWVVVVAVLGFLAGRASL